MVEMNEVRFKNLMVSYHNIILPPITFPLREHLIHLLSKSKNMKKLIYSLLLLFVFNAVMAQAPQEMNYQAVVRNSLGQPIVNATSVSLRFTIHDSISSGATVFTETQSTTTKSVRPCECPDWAAQ